MDKEISVALHVVAFAVLNQYVFETTNWFVSSLAWAAGVLFSGFLFRNK